MEAPPSVSPCHLPAMPVSAAQTVASATQMATVDRSVFMWFSQEGRCPDVESILHSNTSILHSRLRWMRSEGRSARLRRLLVQLRLRRRFDLHALQAVEHVFGARLVVVHRRRPGAPDRRVDLVAVVAEILQP